jgi:hypothetical protein
MKKIILLFIISVVFYSCNFNSKNEKKGFYDYSKEYDLYRVPLIEPLEIISADRGFSWTFKLPYRQIENKDEIGGDVKKIGIDKSIIVLFTPSTYIFNSMNNAWIVVDVENKTEKAFINESEYNKYLIEKGISQIKLYEVSEVFKVFDTENKLPIEWVKQPKQK